MLMLFLPPWCRRWQMRTKCRCGNACSVGRHLATSQTWRIMWKPSTWRACHTHAQSAIRHQNPNKASELTWKQLITSAVNYLSKVDRSISANRCFQTNQQQIEQTKTKEPLYLFKTSRDSVQNLGLISLKFFQSNDI